MEMRSIHLLGLGPTGSLSFSSSFPSTFIMNDGTTEIYDSTTEATPGPTTRIRLYLRASNLPRSLTPQGYRQPDTLARVSVFRRCDDDNGTTPDDPSSLAAEKDSENKSRCDAIIDETEVVQTSSNPRWTVNFSVNYEYGSQLLFFVEVFVIRGSDSSETKSCDETFFRDVKICKHEIKLLGRAVFDVQDVLGTKSRVRARRLKKGGYVYACMEQQSDVISINSSSQVTALDFRSSRDDAGAHESKNNTMFLLRLRASSLVHTRSIQSKLSPNTVSKPDTYFEIARPPSLRSEWIVVYRSSLVKESASPTWDEAMIPLESLSSKLSECQCESEIDLNEYPVMITVFKAKKKKCKVIGSFETTVQALIDASLKVPRNETETAKLSSDELQFVGVYEENQGVFQLRQNEPGSSNEIRGDINVVEARLDCEQRQTSQRFLNSESYDDCSTITSLPDDTEPSNLEPTALASPATPHKFVDYVNAGLDIDFCVAIDFTSSNGDPRIPGTLHYSRDGMMNDYEEAIESIGTTIRKYSSSKQFPVWGFGAKYDGEVRHIFQCGDPTADDIEGALKAYRTVFETDLIMSGPTVISSVLKAAASRARKHAAIDLKYCVLLILTDGIVSDDDLVRTQHLIQSYRNLPLAIVMVGIGRADFTEMHKWNSLSSEERGQFSFVSYRQHQYDSMALSREALQRVPFDIRDYFLRNDIIPE